MARKYTRTYKCEHCDLAFIPQDSHVARGHRFCSNRCCGLARNGSLRDRFEARYIPEPNSGCWLWTAGTFRFGYGQISDQGKSRTAHRVSYELNIRKLRDDEYVLHRCDNPYCVNPEHLFLGTQKDNMRDMSAKGRSGAFRGEQHNQARLTAAQVAEGRKLGMTPKEFAALHGVHKSTAARALNGKLWGHL